MSNSGIQRDEFGGGNDVGTRLTGNSRVVTSAQTTVHDDLLRVVNRHLTHVYQRPLGGAAEDAYAAFRARWEGAAPLVFDSGCGVGDSTRNLAKRHPEALVVGIDKSSDRLHRARPEALPDNAMLLRADLVDFWPLAAADGLRLQHHYLLYPNPWPKIGHLKRRWHGHPVFPALLSLGGRIELRSNWPIYLDEFAQAAQAAENCKLWDGRERLKTGAWAMQREVLSAGVLADPLTPFERKYAASGQTLHRLVIELGT